MRRTYLAALLALFHAAAGCLFGGSPAFAGNGAFTGNAAGGFPEARETPLHESAAAETPDSPGDSAGNPIRGTRRTCAPTTAPRSTERAIFSFRIRGYAVRHAGRGLETELLQRISVDGKPHGKVTAEGPAKTIAGRRTPTVCNTVLYRNEPRASRDARRSSLSVPTGPLCDAPQAPGRHIEFIGDSHTCGYGTEGNSKEPFTPETENCDLAGPRSSHATLTQTTRSSHTWAGTVRNWGIRE